MDLEGKVESGVDQATSQRDPQEPYESPTARDARADKPMREGGHHGVD